METYTVTTKHPNGYMDGEHRFTVKPAPGREGFFYCTAKGFGCSKDYPGAERAIRAMCADHACTVLKIEEVQP